LLTARESHKTTILVRPDEPTKPLFQAQGSVRQHVVAKGVAAARFDRLRLRRDEWLRRHTERESRQDQRAQGVTRDIDPFPEAGGAQQKRAAVTAEASQQRVTLVLAVD
jgi:hypothetical protein